MLIKGIDFPEALLRAQAAGELVVFAGAGVSAAAPSSLPLFDALAELIGRPTGVRRQPQEPVERYLGRLKKQGVHVHDASARILVNESTKPHPLHGDLIQLFTSPEKVRLVTTNFDIHFSTAGRQIFSTPIETFYAPALPLGDDFAGLVYLHGCAGKQPLHCVLTDEDFGRAYLTQAWASRFLSAMFSRYHVLFVGYSHDDTVMSYLARGLPPGNANARFVFSTEDPQQLEKWRFLGIKPLTYKLSGEEHRHGSVSVSVGEWVSELKRGLLEKEQRIQSIAESEPPLEGEDSDYIKLSLSHLPTAQLFCKYARSPRWIIWLEQHDFLKPLFVPYAETGDLHRVLAFWLTEHFFTLNADHLFGIIQRSGGKLHRILTWCIWRRLCMRDRDVTIGTVFSQWVVFLLNQPHDILQEDDWGQLLNHCSLPDDHAAALLLFDFLTKPRIRLEQRWLLIEESDTGGTVDFDLNLNSDLEHWISEAWDTRIKPNLAAFVAQLEPIVARNLKASHQILEIYGRASVDRDPFYLHRQAISEANENGFRRTIDILIEAGKEIACHWLETNPKQAHAMLDRYQSSGVPILQRLAVFGFGRRGDLSADEKLRWLLDADLVYRFKTDVFDFLRGCYGSATDRLKQELLDRVLKGPDKKKLSGVDQSTVDYEIYNFLVWLNRASPECPLTLQTMQALRAAHPDFAEREHPDLDYWFGGVQSVDPVGGLNLDKVMSQEPGQFLDELLAWQPRNPIDRSRVSYCSAVAAAVAKKPEWGLSWVNTLIERGRNDPDLWACVCQGWRNATLTSDQWRLILGLAQRIVAPSEFFQSFVDVLEHGSRRPQDALPDEQMVQAHVVADRIWELALKNLPALDTGSHRDWLTTALNHPGGRIAEFWLQRISVARKAAAESWAGFPSQIVNSLTAMIDGNSGAAAMARVVFASQLHYFFSLDAQYAATKLLPVFDWNDDGKRAEQCWDGFIFWGRWLPGLTEQLLPHFRETINQINRFPQETRKRLINHVAGISVFLIENPLAHDWLFEVLSSLESQDRIELARAFDRLLEDATTQITESVWERWFKKYWETRLLQIPKPLVTKEANEMVSWPLGFGKYYPDAVHLVLPLGNAVRFEHCDLPYRLQRRELAKRFPEATGELLMFYLMTKPKFFHLSNEGLALWKELKLHLQGDPLKRIREAMLELGFDPEGG